MGPHCTSLYYLLPYAVCQCAFGTHTLSGLVQPPLQGTILHKGTDLLLFLSHHGDCWCPGAKQAPGHQQPPCWLDYTCWFLYKKVDSSHNSNTTLMGKCKKDVTPLLMYWSYVFLAQTRRHVICTWHSHLHLELVHPMLSYAFIQQLAHKSA